MQKKQAFSIVELMIVVAIIAFLAAIAVPQYFKYLAKAKQTEVMVNLASLHTAQQAYFAQHGRYTNKLWGDDSLGWRPEGSKKGKATHYYTYGFYFSGAQEGVHYFVGKLSAEGKELGQCVCEGNSFVAKAAADLMGKGNVDVWQVDQERTITNIKNGF